MELLHRVTYKLGSLHEPALDFGTGVPLYRAEIHTIKAIGDNPGINMMGLAGRMGVTKGAASQVVGKLESKGLVRKVGADDNAKEVLPELTDLGWTGYREHERQHDRIYEVVRSYYGKGMKRKLGEFLEAMTDLDAILSLVEREEAGR